MQVREREELSMRVREREETLLMQEREGEERPST